MPVQLDQKAKRKWFGLGPKIRTVELPDGTTTEDFQDWAITFGYKNARRAKNQTKVKGVCRDALEADRSGTYLYEKLVEAAEKKHKKNLFDASYYWLQYQMPDAPFVVNVEIDDPDQVLRAYKEFDELEKQPELKRKLVRRLIPRSLLKTYGDAPVFDERPAKKVRTGLRTRPLMTQFLVQQFLAGSKNMEIEKFDQLMEAKLIDFKVEVYASLPKSEKPDHQYLIADSKVKKKKAKATLEEKYLAGEIDLQQYSDEKFPERAAKRQARLAVYPLPERQYTCVICGKPDCAPIKCMECENRACKACVVQNFGTSAEASERCFILLHHTYCLKFGRPLVRKVSAPGSKPGAVKRASAG